MRRRSDSQDQGVVSRDTTMINSYALYMLSGLPKIGVVGVALGQKTNVFTN